jgi:hypothetical protein
MPVNRSLAKKLVKKYGAKKAKSVYYGMEAKGKPAFKKGLKTAKKEGHTMAKFPKSKAKKKK